MSMFLPSDHSSALPQRRIVIDWLMLVLFTALLSAGATRVHAAQDTSQRRIIIAIADKPDPAPLAGSTPRGYSGLPNYSGSERVLALTARIAREHALQEISAWTIEPLRLRCVLFEIPATADREKLLGILRKDRRVLLAQPLQEFATLSTPSLAVAPAVATVATAYNDPYVGLQTGFSSIAAAQAQRWSNGKRITVALIDTGVDAQHPDLAGRIGEQRDFVAEGMDAPEHDRHGTEVAGVIAAVANNGVGIVGVSPGVRVLSYRACWPVEAHASAARCDSFTLAQALGAAITSHAQVINLSLGGPSDPLLAQLLEYAIGQGTIVVGAMPIDASMAGFPVSTPGVIAVADNADAGSMSATRSLFAPGREILTLEPGGTYDYASGSSLATAHVTGTIALLLELSPDLDAAALFALMSQSARTAGGPIDACAALRAVARSNVYCAENPGSMEPANGSR